MRAILSVNGDTWCRSTCGVYDISSTFPLPWRIELRGSLDVAQCVKFTIYEQHFNYNILSNLQYIYTPSHTSEPLNCSRCDAQVSFGVSFGLTPGTVPTDTPSNSQIIPQTVPSDTATPPHDDPQSHASGTGAQHLLLLGGALRIARCCSTRGIYNI